MTITEEARRLRAEAAKLRPDRYRRYPAELRRRLLDWVDRAVSGGMTEAECGHAVGIKVWRFKSWRAMSLPAGTTLTAGATEPLALVPIKVTGMPVASQLTVVTPSGHRVEGLTLEQAIVLLRELA